MHAGGDCLMNTNEVYRFILNNPYGSIFITDSKGTIAFVNLGAEKLLGKKKNELIGTNVQKLLQEGFYDKSTVLECISKKQLVVGQLKAVHGKRFMAVSIPIINKEGKILATITNSLDNAIVSDYMTALTKEQQKSRKYRETIQYLFDMDQISNQFIAESPCMKPIMMTAQRVAGTDCNVLILGESGTGKDVLSNYIHHHSLRAKEPFIPINCATIPADLLESELFGYEKGAFTGANDKGKMGILEMANHGTLFLDEVGEMPLPLQAKFLRILETGEVQRLGSTVIKKIDFRLIAATNRNLLEMVRNGTFRDDLYYRLNVVPVTLPPLRERPEDIKALANMFLARFNTKYNEKKKLSSVAVQYLQKYDWPGNIRELQNVIERYVITDMDISSLVQIKSENANDLADITKDTLFEFRDLKEYMREIEKSYIERAVAACDGKVSEAAKKLHVHRTLIYKKLEPSKK